MARRSRRFKWNIEGRTENKYNGHSKDRTLDCKGCDFLHTIRAKDLCIWGRSYQVLRINEPKRHCPYIDQKPQEDCVYNWITGKYKPKYFAITRKLTEIH